MGLAHINPSAAAVGQERVRRPQYTEGRKWPQKSDALCAALKDASGGGKPSSV
jgi:hypothetical protein